MSKESINSPEFVQIETADGLTLPGLMYAAQDSQKAAIYLHGNGSSSIFYDDDLRTEQVKALNNVGISYLLFNNRGAHIIKSFNVKDKDNNTLRKRFGMAYEKIKECVYDIDAAISYLESEGYTEFYLVGESTGANKICVYHYYKPNNKISKNILLAGGDDVGIYYTILGETRFKKLLAESQKKIQAGKGDEIILELLPNEIFSYTGFQDIANPDGDYNVFPFLEVLRDIKLSNKKLFRYFESISSPTLVVYGEKDEYAYDSIPEIITILRNLKPDFDYKIIEEADHAFSKHQKELSELMVDWLAI